MTKVKKVYKYGTGDIIPEGAVYLCTKVEDIGDGGNRYTRHYFLVEVEVKEKYEKI